MASMFPSSRLDVPIGIRNFEIPKVSKNQFGRVIANFVVKFRTNTVSNFFKKSGKFNVDCLLKIETLIMSRLNMMHPKHT